MNDRKFYSSLAVLKLHGAQNQNYLSFPMSGYSLAMDFPANEKTLYHLKELDKIVVKYQGKIYSRCIYIWVDKDFSAARGQFQGYPKKIGSIHLTRSTTVGKAGPRLQPGGIFGATLAAYDHRLVQAKFTIESESDHAGFVNALPMLHNRWMPAIECNGKDSLNEVVTMSGFDAEIGLTFKGSFELELFSSPVEEFHLLEPEELIKGYYRQVGVSWKGGRT